MSDIDSLPPPRGMEWGRRQAVRDLLEEEVRRSQRPWWRRSRRTATVSIGAMALVLAGGAASAYVAFKAPTDLASVVCFSAATPQALDGFGGNQVAVAEPEPAAGEKAKAAAPAHTDRIAGKDPIGTCSALWRTGKIVAGANGVNQDTRRADDPAAVPNLVACTLEEGVAGVFPGDAKTCERLGLPSAIR
ncbi:hypothetical protein [Tenggerimyces flavus]|uniref:Uncharacterized protein n=1 Tax=Tenggerimyces flavus TaxID=1708749 RepID=A0ABV7YGE1_9ACTN|nr:hypothetical protein [Tenggerimyces flavus]MBM7784207.1 putative iron-regulated membrane protein [Tenggerimyces flavus]